MFALSSTILFFVPSHFKSTKLFHLWSICFASCTCARTCVHACQTFRGISNKEDLHFLLRGYLFINTLSSSFLRIYLLIILYRQNKNQHISFSSLLPLFLPPFGFSQCIIFVNVCLTLYILKYTYICITLFLSLNNILDNSSSSYIQIAFRLSFINTLGFGAGFC